MARNNAWANATLHAAVGSLPEGAFTAPRPGFFASLCETLNHIHLVDLYYIDALEDGGDGLDIFTGKGFPDPAALTAAQAETDGRLIRLCDALTPRALNEPHVTMRKDGPVEEETAALLLHLFQHQIHHRGQAHVQLSDAGVTPPQLDDFHLRFGRVPSAQACWDRNEQV
jgi:uncharacterized damage-inducible protein DinB